MGEILEITTLYAETLGAVFTALDSVYIQSGISYLDVVLAVAWFGITIRFTRQMISQNKTTTGKNEKIQNDVRKQKRKFGPGY